MAILFILDGQISVEAINTFLSVCSDKDKAEMGPDVDGTARGVLRIVTSKDSLNLGPDAEGGPHKPPVGNEILANNAFADMSMDELEAWMLFRAKMSADRLRAEDEDDPRRSDLGHAPTSYFALDAKDIEGRTCTALEMKRKDEFPVSKGVFERPVVKVRVPWEDVWEMVINFDDGKIELESFTIECGQGSVGNQLPKDGWCTYQPILAPWEKDK